MTKAYIVAFLLSAGFHAGLIFGFSHHEEGEEESNLVEVSLDAAAVAKNQQEEPEQAKSESDQPTQEEVTAESLLPEEFLAAGIAEPPSMSVSSASLTQTVRVDPPRAPRPDRTQIGIPDAAQRASSGSQLASTIFDIKDLDRPPARRFTEDPKVPASLKSKGGLVVLKMVINEDGTVAEITVVESTSDEFARNCQQVCKRWKFEPGVKNGKPVRFSVLQPFKISPK